VYSFKEQFEYERDIMSINDTSGDKNWKMKSMKDETIKKGSWMANIAHDF
jgi:hypothetical protein